MENEGSVNVTMNNLNLAYGGWGVGGAPVIQRVTVTIFGATSTDVFINGVYTIVDGVFLTSVNSGADSRVSAILLFIAHPSF